MFVLIDVLGAAGVYPIFELLFLEPRPGDISERGYPDEKQFPREKNWGRQGMVTFSSAPLASHAGNPWARLWVELAMPGNQDKSMLCLYCDKPLGLRSARWRLVVPAPEKRKPHRTL